MPDSAADAGTAPDAVAGAGADADADADVLPPEARNVLIIGAGPAGLLTAIFLLRRNRTDLRLPPRPQYRVTVVDPGVNYGLLSEDELAGFRSWMIGLSCHGLGAVRSVPGLYEKYVRGMGIHTRYGVTGFGRFVMPRVRSEDMGAADMDFTVDRNYIVSALARYLEDEFGGTEEYRPMFGTRAMFVDGENRRVLVRATEAGRGGSAREADGAEAAAGAAAAESDGDRYLGYDLLIGCDGIRSVVRNAFVARHREFEFDIKCVFSGGKSVHLPLPDGVDEGTFMLLFNCMPKASAFVLPETGRKVNFACGFRKNEPWDPELFSDDIKVVSGYLREHFKAFPVDYDLFAREWVDQDVVSTQQVHCNFYHSLPLRALLLGDAAHATSPARGQGMNTALADARVLNELLDEHGDGEDCLDAVLANFSEERVKEGNALTDLSMHTFSLSTTQQLWLVAQETGRDWLHRRCPALFDEYPMTSVTARGMKLSDAYDRLTKMGIVPRARRTNDDIMRRHFERTVGMVKEDGGRGGACAWAVSLAALSVALVVAVVHFSPSEGRDWKMLA